MTKMSFLCMPIHLCLSLGKKKNVLVNIMMMNINYDKQYKTEPFVMLKYGISSSFFFTGYLEELFSDVCVDAKKEEAKENERR
jgi:hypothetical protein